jgi:hypothetical protein
MADATDIIAATTASVKVVDVYEEAEAHLARGAAHLAQNVVAAASTQVESSRAEVAALESAHAVIASEYTHIASSIDTVKQAAAAAAGKSARLQTLFAQIDGLDAAMTDLGGLAVELAAQSKQLEAAVQAALREPE